MTVTSGSKYRKAPTFADSMSRNACAQITYATPEQKIPRNRTDIHPVEERLITEVTTAEFKLNGMIMSAIIRNRYRIVIRGEYVSEIFLLTVE